MVSWFLLVFSFPSGRLSLRLLFLFAGNETDTKRKESPRRNLYKKPRDTNQETGKNHGAISHSFSCRFKPKGAYERVRN